MDWNAHPNDLYLEHKPLSGCGKWVDCYVHVDLDSRTVYEVWVDQDGDSKIVETGEVYDG